MEKVWSTTRKLVTELVELVISYSFRPRVTLDRCLSCEIEAESKKDHIPHKEGRREHNATDFVHLQSYNYASWS